MNPIFPLFTIASLYTTPLQQIAPQVYYVANLSETEGAKCGEYITITPQQPIIAPQYRVTPDVIIPEEREAEGD
jgi:hypothetical protein